MKLQSTNGSRWALMSKFDIPDRHNPAKTYLRRWRLVQTPWFGIYLHKIILPDPDYHLHDHPWNFGSLILKNSYVEKLPHNGNPLRFSYRARRWLSYSSKQAEDLHSICSITNDQPVWTLIFTGRRRRNWGFETESGWIPWETYLSQH